MPEPSNKARIGDAFDLLAQGLEPFVSVHMAPTVRAGQDWADVFARGAKPPITEFSTSDPGFLLRVMTDCWRGTFDRQLPRSARNLLFTLRDKRNEWAHNRAIQHHDAQFTLSGILTLLEAVDAKEAGPVRVSLDELSRAQYRRARDRAGAASSNVLDAPRAGLRPWREVVHPHPDVRSGHFSVAEFAADLEMVRLGEGSTEYTDPRLFFERTFLTAGLRKLLELGVQRLTGRAGQPVINCQTNFGGGKTHSLIALYHLFSGVALDSLPPEVAALVRAAGAEELPTVKRAVVVGNRFGAGEEHHKPDGTAVNTIWGEIAWQLGGAEGYGLVADSDRNRTNPGDAIRSVLVASAPCLILVDEWVAYARELYEREGLPGGSFESQFGFAQTLAEATRATPGALFVVSIPASEDDRPGEPPSVSSLEVGGVAGREALRRLTNATDRLAESWQPASGDESYEIVRRRLFQPIPPESEADRDATAEAFGEFYRSQRAEFPRECSEMSYVQRIKAAYPIHPEVFDCLYEAWATVERFQRTRGVLRLMAATINSLWESDDKSPLILPCSIPLGDTRVTAELAGKLSEYWNPVIDADIDGTGSHSAEIDRTTPHLGALHATRRIARTIFVGATPTVGSANQGLEMDRIRLGATFAGEKPGPIADALNRLAARAPHLYADRNRYWFNLQQNVNRTARDDADRLLAGNKHEVHAEIVRRLRLSNRTTEFSSVHTAPATADEVADDPRARLVVLGPDVSHIAGSENSTALEAAGAILEYRGSAPRQYLNMLVFAAADQRALEGLEQSVAEYLAWAGICGRADQLNLDAHQGAQARTQRDNADRAADLRLGTTYNFALVPCQDDPLGKTDFEEIRVGSQGSVAERVASSLTDDGTLRLGFPAVMLRQRLNGKLAARWAAGHVTVAKLWDDFARYVYLPRLRDRDVLLEAVRNGPASVLWQTEGFAVAAGFDEATGRYLGLVSNSYPESVTPTTLVVHPDRALAQLSAERSEPPVPPSDDDDASGTSGTPGAASAGGPPGESPPGPPAGPTPATVFRGSVPLDPTRPARSFSQISTEVLEHLVSLPNADINIRLDITIRKADGFPEKLVRDITENTRTLKFDDATGFSED